MNEQDRYYSLHQALTEQARNIPRALAIAAPGRPPMDYVQLFGQIESMARTLGSMGVQRNDRVAVILPTSAEMAVAFLAVSCCATAAPLNPAYQEAELDFYLADLNARALVVMAGLDTSALQVARRLGIPILEVAVDLTAPAGTLLPDSEPADSATTCCHSEADDIALVLHTSGTTARPKMVPLTHSNVCASAYNIQAALQLTERDRCLNFMPLYHTMGLMSVTTSLVIGSSAVCTGGFDPDFFFRWVDEFRPTWYTAAPTLHQAILGIAPGHQEILRRAALRFVRSSAAPLPAVLMTRLEEVLGVPVLEGYGMTETALQATSNPLPPGIRKPGSVGVQSGVEVAIMDELGTKLPSGEVGEIVFRGPNVTNGYLNNPEANQQAFFDGWLRSGDQGFFDADGYLFIQSRLKEIINRGGQKISPREVEETILDHPAVDQVAVFAVPHASLGEAVAAAIVLNAGHQPTQREIRAFAAERLAPFKVPQQLVFVDAIPRGAT